jgi:hypothetical protein
MLPSMIMRSGEPYDSLNVSILPDDVFGMREALAGGVLNAPALPRWRPLNFGPKFPVDREVVGFGIDAADLDYAVASTICHVFHPLL